MLNRCRRCTCSIVIVLLAVISLATLLAWLFHVPALIVLVDGFPTMKASTALCFFLIALYLANLLWRGSQRGSVLLVAVVVLAGVSLIEYGIDSDIGIDQLLASDPYSEFHPGRMSMATAVNFILAAALLYGLPHWQNTRPRLMDGLFITYVSILGVSLVNYLLEPEELFKIAYFSSFSVPTLIGFFLIGIALIMNIQQGSSRVALIMRDAPGAKRFRFLFVSILLIPAAIGSAMLDLETRGVISDQFAISLYIVVTIVVVFLILASAARREEIYYQKLVAERKRYSTLQQKLSSVIDVSSEALLLFSVHGQVLHANRGASMLFGWSRDELMNMKMDEFVPERLRTVHEKHVDDFINSGRESLENNDPIRMVALHKDGHEIPILTTITKKYLGNELLVAFSAKNAQTIHSHLESLDDKACRDPLTGVYNRYAMNNYLEEINKGGKRHGDCYSVLMIDVDYFKSINDTWGHEAGDEALKQVTTTIASCLRATEQLYRYGGEEFVVIVPGMERQHAYYLAERIRNTVRDRSVAYQGQLITLTCSIGYAHGEVGEQSISAVLRRADNAVYEAKRRGRDRCVSAD